MDHVVFNNIDREIKIFEGSEEEVLRYLRTVAAYHLTVVWAQPGDSNFLLRGDIYLDEEIRGLARDKRPEITPEMVAYLKKLGLESGWPRWWLEQISRLAEPEVRP